MELTLLKMDFKLNEAIRPCQVYLWILAGLQPGLRLYTFIVNIINATTVAKGIVCVFASLR
jgi:hypothetical protein